MDKDVKRLKEKLEELEKRVLALECWHTPQGCTQKEREEMINRAAERWRDSKRREQIRSASR